MSRKVTVTELDPTKEVFRIHVSSEHDNPQYFDKEGNRIALVEREIDYKPEYDFETRKIKHWWYKNESELFRDVHHKVRVFRSRTTIGKYLKAIFWVQLDKRILRFLRPTQ